MEPQLALGPTFQLFSCSSEIRGENFQAVNGLLILEALYGAEVGSASLKGFPSVEKKVGWQSGKIFKKSPGGWGSSFF